MEFSLMVGTTADCTAMSVVATICNPADAIGYDRTVFLAG